MRVGLIVAHSLNNVIGKDGCIPWKIKNEQKQFKELTTNNIIIMGRRTYEEIGKALPNRINIVITSKSLNDKNIICFDNLYSAMDYSRTLNKNIYIVGGEMLYKEALENLNINDLYITVINKTIDDGDRFFPKFNEYEYSFETIETNDLYTRYHYYK